MKLSRRNNALHYLNEKDGLIFSTCDNTSETQKALVFLHSQFPKLRERFREKIQYICDPFWHAYEKGREKLVPVFASETVAAQGTIIFSTSGGNVTVFYDVATTNNESHLIEGTIIYFYSRRDDPEPYLYSLGHFKEHNQISYLPEPVRQQGLTLDAMILNVIFLCLFQKYCSIETKIVAQNRKEKHGNEQYKNETSVPIEILDSTWFTNIVRSEGFWVGKEDGGFFRWQPKGKDRTQRELIWVRAFEKEGYSRKAKSLQDRAE